MRNMALLAAIIFTGCSIKVTTRGQAFVEGHSPVEVFDKALESVIAADMNPTATDRSTGLIAATKAGGLLSGSGGKELRITLRVKEQGDGSVMVDLSATLGGQLVAYGATRGMVEDLCKELSVRLPGATFKIDGRPYTPGQSPNNAKPGG